MKKVLENMMCKAVFVFFVVVLNSASSYSQVVVAANPALGSFDITNQADLALNANALEQSSVFKLKLSVYNLHLLNAIPVGSAYIDIGLGTRAVLEPGFDLGSAPLNNYFTFTYTTGSQGRIRCDLHTPLPKDFAGELVFNLRSNILGTSNITSNFLISNYNPSYTLTDTDPTNNSASINYTVIPTTLPVTFKSIKAYQAGNNIAVEWNVQNETKVKHYEVEKSTDGRTFTYAETQVATGNQMSSVKYNWLDKDAVVGNNYYRVRSVDVDGSTQYTQVVKVFVGNIKGDFTIYPNPITGKTINLQFINQPQGIYELRLINSIGQVMMKKQITHLQGSSTETISLPSGLQKGNYLVEINTPFYSKQVLKIIY